MTRPIISFALVLLLAAPGGASTPPEHWLDRYAAQARGEDQPAAVAADCAGRRVFVTGWSESPSGSFAMTTIGYDAATGARLWVARTAGGADRGSAIAVAPDGATVFATGRSGSINQNILTVAYDAITGAERWRAMYDGPAAGADQANAIAADATSVYVTGFATDPNTAQDIVVLAYDGTTGAPRWTTLYDGPGRNNFGGPSSTDRGTSIALDPAGARVYVGGNSSALGVLDNLAVVAFDAITGAYAWEWRDMAPGYAFLLGSWVGVSPDGRRVYSTGANSVLGSSNWATQALDAETGAQVWRNVRLDGGTDNPWALAVAPDGSQIFVAGRWDYGGGGAQFQVAAFDAAGGAVRWRTDVGSGAYSQGRSISVTPGSDRVIATGLAGDSLLLTSHFETAALDAQTGAVRCQDTYAGAGGFGVQFAWSVATTATGSYVTGSSDADPSQAANLDIVTTGLHAPATAAVADVVRLEIDGVPQDLGPVSGASSSATGTASDDGELIAFDLPQGLGTIRAGATTATSSLDTWCGSARATSSIASAVLLGGRVEIHGVTSGSRTDLNGDGAASTGSFSIASLRIDGVTVAVPTVEATIPFPDGRGEVRVFERNQRSRSQGEARASALDVSAVHVRATLDDDRVVDLWLASARSAAADRPLNLP